MNMRAFAAELAAALGEGWSIVPATQEWHTDHPSIQHKDGYGFWLSGPDGAWSHRKGSYGVHANYPKDEKGQELRPYFSSYNGEKDPCIYFTEKKTPAQAAGDITRRFLPAYLPLWEKQNERANADALFRAERRQMAKGAAGIVGGEVIEDSSGVAAVRIPYRDSDKGPRVSEIKLNRRIVEFTVTGDLQLLAEVQRLIEKRS